MKSNTRDIHTILREQVVPAGTTRYGVVIGIEEYRDERLRLRCARADAEAMYELMIEPDCGMLKADNVTLLLNEAATKESIWNALAAIRRKAGKNDTVWVYYAGHAAPEGNDFYWIPFDGNVDDLYATGLSRGQISQVLDDIAAERVVTFLDCCHAAATAVQKNTTRAVLTAEQMLSGYQGKGRVILSASEGKEKSVELPEKGHGAFTYYLTKGLRGAADFENTGVVHLDGLWKYLEGKVSDASQQAGNQQTPQLLGKLSHKLALSLNPLETHKKRQIVDKIRGLVGLDDDQLTTEEARYCLDILSHGPKNDAERDVASDFSSVLDGSIRIVTFKRLIQAAMNTKVSQARASQPTTHSLPPTTSESKVKESDQKFSKASELDTIRKRHSLDEKKALQLVDDWSVEHPEYLNPISQHAELVEYKNWGGFVAWVRALVETREVELNQEPFCGNSQDIQTERMKDKWEIPITIPGGFDEATETYAAAVPQRIFTCKICGGKGELSCPECNGSGNWVCKECHGTGQVKCNKCNGTGEIVCPKCYGKGMERWSDGSYDSKKECSHCNGDKKIPCTCCKGIPKKVCPTCHGKPEQSCHNCGGTGRVLCNTCSSSGRLAEVPIVLAKFTPVISKKTVCEDSTFTDDLSDESGAEVFNDTTTNHDLPWGLEGFPIKVIKQVQNLWKKVIQDTSGKIHRINLVIDYVCGVTCKMKYKETAFEINVLGQDHVVRPSNSTPKNMKYIENLEADIKYFYGKSRFNVFYVSFMSALLMSIIIMVLPSPFRDWLLPPNHPGPTFSIFMFIYVTSFIVSVICLHIGNLYIWPSKKNNDAFFDTITKTLVSDCFSHEVALIPQTSEDKDKIWDEAEKYVAKELRRRGVVIVPLKENTPKIQLNQYRQRSGKWENIGVIIISSTGKQFEYETR